LPWPITMRQQRTLIPIVFILFLLVWPALVQADFQAGMDAHNQGDYATALKEWRPLAELGEAEAQYKLGALYYQGIGVPQDDAEAVRWYRFAATPSPFLCLLRWSPRPTMQKRVKTVPLPNRYASRRTRPHSHGIRFSVLSSFAPSSTSAA